MIGVKARHLRPSAPVQRTPTIRKGYVDVAFSMGFGPACGTDPHISGLQLISFTTSGAWQYPCDRIVAVQRLSATPFSSAAERFQEGEWNVELVIDPRWFVPQSNFTMKLSGHGAK